MVVAAARVAAGEVVVGALVPILVPVVGLVPVAAVLLLRLLLEVGGSSAFGSGGSAAAAAGGGGGSSARQGQCCSCCWRRTVGGSNVSSGGGCVKGRGVGGCTSSSDLCICTNLTAARADLVHVTTF